MIHPESGEILHRDTRKIEYRYKNEKIIVEQTGWYPDEGDDGILDSEDMKVWGDAVRTLKARYAEKISQNNISAENLAFA